MSTILTPVSRRNDRERFVAKNPWTPGLTIAQIKEAVDSGEQTLKGGWVFPEPTGKKPRASRTTKGGSPKGAKRASTVQAKPKLTKAQKAEKAAKKAKREEFRQWLGDTAEQRATRKAANAKQAEWMRKNGIQPNGSAWMLCSKGERSVAKLKAANDADAKASGKKVKAPKVTATVVAEVTTDTPAQTVRPRRANGTFMSSKEGEVFTRLVNSGQDENVARIAASALAGL